MNSALLVFLFFVAVVLGLSAWLSRRARSLQGYYAAHGEIPWFINGMAFAGDYLSAASFLGICGLIATTGYDGFLYSIGYLAGWVVALFVIAEPIKRLGRFTFADALDSTFDSRGIKLAAAISTLVVSLFYLIPQMVGAGSLMQALLGWEHWAGVLMIGGVVITIVTTAGMVSTTWVQFIKGSLLVVLCAILVVFILVRGLSTTPPGTSTKPFQPFLTGTTAQMLDQPGSQELPADGGWAHRPYHRIRSPDGQVRIWHQDPDGQLSEAQILEKHPDGTIVVNGRLVPPGSKPQDLLKPIGSIAHLPDGAASTGSLSPAAFLTTLQGSIVVLWGSETLTQSDGSTATVYFQKPTRGDTLLRPGGGMFKGIDSSWKTRLNFLSLMLALFAGTASLPHILIRYYTVKDQQAARRSTVVGIAAIGFFYVLTLFIGLGAMTSGVLDLTNTTGDMSAPLLAHSFGTFFFAVISAVAFTTILGTVSGLIMASSGAIVHDLLTSVVRLELDDQAKVRSGKIAAVGVGILAMVLGILFKNLNPTYLVGWAFSIAASANLPSLVMLLFWRRTTRAGIISSITVGMLSSLGWILLSADTFKKVYGIDPAHSPMPFSQPGIVTIPLSFLVLILVSLATRRQSVPSH